MYLRINCINFQAVLLVIIAQKTGGKSVNMEKRGIFKYIFTKTGM